MSGWLGVLEILGLVLVLGVMLLVLLAARRRWLARSGGEFGGSLRLGTTPPGAGWGLGGCPSTLARPQRRDVRVQPPVAHHHAGRRMGAGRRPLPRRLPGVVPVLLLRRPSARDVPARTRSGRRHP